ncbi:WxL domain-containing protein [Aerococcus viridans]
MFKIFVTNIFSLMLLFSYSLVEDNEVKAVDIGLIGGATTHSSYEDGLLSVGLQGGSAVGLSIGTTIHPQVKLPDSLSPVLKHPDISDNIKIEYARPFPIGLGFITRSGTISGDDLMIDTTNNIVSGSINRGLSFNLIGLYEFNFIIDIGGLDMRIPEDTYEFHITVGQDSINLNLLNFPENRTSITFGYTVPANPDNGETDPGEVTTSTDHASTEVGISFLPSMDAAPPILDPENPNEEIDPPDNPTGESGPLTLDYVPSFNFNGEEVSIKDKQLQSISTQPFIQVTDRRPQTDGWQLIGQLKEFQPLDYNGHQTSLNGSVLHLKGGDVSSPIASREPFVFQDIQLVAGGDEVPIIYALPDSGAGTWLTRWYPTESTNDQNDQVILDVPGESISVGEHQATIEWTLYNVPEE